MYSINPEVIIANYFGEFPKKEELRFSTLTEVCIRVEKELAYKFVFIKRDKDSLFDAICGNSRYFSLNHSRQVIVFNSSKINEFYEDLYCIFNSKLDKEIKWEFLVILEKILKALETVPVET